MAQKFDISPIVAHCQRLLDIYHDPSTTSDDRRAVAADMRSVIATINRLLSPQSPSTPGNLSDTVGNTPDSIFGNVRTTPATRLVSTASGVAIPDTVVSGLAPSSLPLLAECRDFLTRSLR